MSHREHGEEEDGGGGARCSPSGPQGPFFMIFLYLDRLFWNHIFTWRTRRGKRLKTDAHSVFISHDSGSGQCFKTLSINGLSSSYFGGGVN